MPDLEGLMPLTVTYLNCNADPRPEVTIKSYSNAKTPPKIMLSLTRENRKNPYLVLKGAGGLSIIREGQDKMYMAIRGDLTMHLDNGIKQGFAEDGILDEKKKVPSLNENYCKYLPKTQEI
jgi:hypothetical protein